MYKFFGENLLFFFIFHCGKGWVWVFTMTDGWGVTRYTDLHVYDVHVAAANCRVLGRKAAYIHIYIYIYTSTQVPYT